MNTYEKQYEIFVGRRFYHKDNENLIYTFADIDENNKAIILNRSFESATYDVEHVLSLIRDSTWIIEN